MRVRLRDVVDLRYDVELKELTYWERIICAVKKRYMESKLFEASRDKSIEKQYKERMKIVEDLTVVLLHYINTRLIKNNVMKKKGETAEYIVIAINRVLEDAVDTLLESNDLVSYDIDVVKPNHNMLLSFPNLPILLMIRKKVLKSKRYILDSDENDKMSYEELLPLAERV